MMEVNKGKGNRNINLVSIDGEFYYKAVIEITFSDHVNCMDDVMAFIDNHIKNRIQVKDYWIIDLNESEE